MRLHPGKHLIHAEGLYNIIVSAGLKAVYPVLLLGAGCEKENGAVDIIPDFLTDGIAHLRREARRQKSGSVYIKGDLTVDFSGRQVLVKGEDAGLTKTEFASIPFLAV